ncbi:hypothetical protein KL921_005021 [Ogataea angusta]|uniref:Zn(2)-C6 fungal-type domain-containing protein n=1 Tax=Pichia angusta TaxID=870730 RepID=A0AAN6DKX0_PICAN|nr:uncharacterized protein KL928_000103 [Ogataea angusta]KAG7806293.1 hypothetical protein KL921_005021 [Ogataea angusta]KAG7819940.1 hypothetical protein KL909_004689 [Ogataea angusta]KAG7821628.1 hypothetical protein KL928_000103 [Ogataea angusta]KAG7827906.1 hypothetical protein KL920_004156 [Ogataea angusta]KAG7836585.1 hypothetical protein KL942_004839 [Ogataea angusta]
MQSQSNSSSSPDRDPDAPERPRLPSFQEIQEQLQSSTLLPSPTLPPPLPQSQLPSISMLLHHTRTAPLPPVPYTSYPVYKAEPETPHPPPPSPHEDSSKSVPDSSKTKNRRTRKACDLCNQKRTKCSGEMPRCSQCIRTNSVCTYLREEKKRGRASSNYPKIIIRRKPTKIKGTETKHEQDILHHPSPHQSPPALSQPFRYPILNQVAHVISQLQISHFLADDLIELYFQTPFPVMILNPNQILTSDPQRVRKVNEGFILSMLLCGAALLQLSPSPSISKESSLGLLDMLFFRTNGFLQRSTKLDHDDIISYINLVRAYAMVGGIHEAIQVINQAISLALKLKINIEDPSEYPILMEEKRRAWYCLVTMEAELKHGSHHPLLTRNMSHPFSSV